MATQHTKKRWWRVRCRNRAVKFELLFEAGTAEEARRLAEEHVAKEIEDERMFSDVRVTSVVYLVEGEEPEEDA